MESYDKTGLLQFCGIEIQVDRTSSHPYIIIDGNNNTEDQNVLSDMNQLVGLLNDISHLYSQPNTHGKIVIVDD